MWRSVRRSNRQTGDTQKPCRIVDVYYDRYGIKRRILRPPHATYLSPISLTNENSTTLLHVLVSLNHPIVPATTAAQPNPILWTWNKTFKYCGQRYRRQDTVVFTSTQLTCVIRYELWSAYHSTELDLHIGVIGSACLWLKYQAIKYDIRRLPPWEGFANDKVVRLYLTKIDK